MRRSLPFALALIVAAAPGFAAQMKQGRPPHAWLFGAWTGGIFPVPAQGVAKACQSGPTVVFTQDAVAHTSLLLPGLTQRIIETAKVNGSRVEFRFVPVSNTPMTLLGQPDQAAGGFGCESPDVLHVERGKGGAISFPGCKDFPNPLVRCPG